MFYENNFLHLVKLLALGCFVQSLVFSRVFQILVKKCLCLFRWAFAVMTKMWLKMASLHIQHLQQAFYALYRAHSKTRSRVRVIDIFSCHIKFSEWSPLKIEIVCNYNCWELRWFVTWLFLAAPMLGIIQVKCQVLREWHNNENFVLTQKLRRNLNEFIYFNWHFNCHLVKHLVYLW